MQIIFNIIYLILFISLFRSLYKPGTYSYYLDKKGDNKNGRK